MCAGIVHQLRGQRKIQHLPLERVTISALVVDVSSRVVITQVFRNPSYERTGRAKYVFPLPSNATVCAFELVHEDGSTIVGEVMADEEVALHTRVARRGNPTSIERVTDNVFTISVGSIAAASKVTVRLTLVIDLLDKDAQDHIQLKLPTHVARAPVTLQDDSVADDHHIRVGVTVDIQTSGIIRDIDCSQRDIRFRRYRGDSNRLSQRRVSVIWESLRFLTEDFIVTIYAEGLDKPRCFAEVIGTRENGDETGCTLAMQLTLVPKFLQIPKISSREYIFIIDRSGSMKKGLVETVKRALSILLRLLPSSETTFNIFSLGTTVKRLWRCSRVLDSDSFSEVTTHLAGMTASFCGTHIHKVLQEALSSRSPDRPATVFLFTDGLITARRNSCRLGSTWRKLCLFQRNERSDAVAIVSNAVRNSLPEAPLRLFVLGIGNGDSSEMCDSLARAGRGQAFWGVTAEDIVGKCARIFTGRYRNIEHVEIDWGHSIPRPRIAQFSSPTTPPLPASVLALEPPPPIQQVPHTLPSIFSASQLTVSTITIFGSTPASVRLTAKMEGESEPQEATIAVTRVKPFPGTNSGAIPLIHTLAAWKLIKELENGTRPLPIPAPEDALLATEEELRKAGIVRLGLTYKLVSKHTPFVAIEEGNEQIRGREIRGGSTAEVRSRLGGQTSNSDISTDSRRLLDNDATFLDNLVDGMASLAISTFDFFIGPEAQTTSLTSSSLSQPHPMLPGAYNASNSALSLNGDDEDRGRRHTRGSSPTRIRGSVSHESACTFPTLSSFEGSSLCSACRMTSRSSTPRGRRQSRTPSPEILQVPSTRLPPHRPSLQPGHLSTLCNLILHMDADGSFSATPMLTWLVGNAAVLNHANASGIDKTVWVTVVVVAYMRIQFEGEPDLLELVSGRARMFVEAAGGASGSGGRARRFERLVLEARKLLSP